MSNIPNLYEVKSDGVNLYINFIVKSKKIGRIILSICIMIIIPFLIFVVSSIDSKDMGSFILPMFLIFFLFIILPIKTLLWNTYGKEILIINTKSISYFYDYYFIKTKIKTIPFDKLGLRFHQVRVEYDDVFGNLVFSDYSKIDDIPRVIHSTSVMLKKEEIDSICEHIKRLFVIKSRENDPFYTISLN